MVAKFSHPHPQFHIHGANPIQGYNPQFMKLASSPKTDSGIHILNWDSKYPTPAVIPALQPSLSWDLLPWVLLSLLRGSSGEGCGRVDKPTSVLETAHGLGVHSENIWQWSNVSFVLPWATSVNKTRVAQYTEPSSMEEALSSSGTFTI